MERQAGLGRSLEEVLDSLTPVGLADSAPRHVLFGIGSDASGTKKKKKKKKSKKKKASGKKSAEHHDKKKKKKSKG